MLGPPSLPRDFAVTLPFQGSCQQRQAPPLQPMYCLVLLVTSLATQDRIPEGKWRQKPSGSAIVIICNHLNKRNEEDKCHHHMIAARVIMMMTMMMLMRMLMLMSWE